MENEEEEAQRVTGVVLVDGCFLFFFVVSQNERKRKK
jgi:hypothetical protein